VKLDSEKAAHSECIIQMQGQATLIRNPVLEGQAALKSFSYDYSYWSIDESNPENFADQHRVFKDLGTNILDNAFSGTRFRAALCGHSIKFSLFYPSDSDF